MAFNREAKSLEKLDIEIKITRYYLVVSVMKLGDYTRWKKKKIMPDKFWGPTYTNELTVSMYAQKVKICILFIYEKVQFNLDHLKFGSNLDHLNTNHWYNDILIRRFRLKVWNLLFKLWLFEVM